MKTAVEDKTAPNRRERDKLAKGAGSYPPCLFCARTNHHDSNCHRGGPWSPRSFWDGKEGKAAIRRLESEGLHWWVEHPNEDAHEGEHLTQPHPPDAPPPQRQQHDGGPEVAQQEAQEDLRGE